MQVRLITLNTPKFGARLSFKELEASRAVREKLATSLTEEKEEAARLRSEIARNAALVNAANHQAKAEKNGRPKIARLKKIATQRRWRGTYNPRTNGIF